MSDRNPPFRAATTDEIAAINRAIALQGSGRLSDAESIYRKLLEGRPAIPELYANLALICASSQRLGEAMQWWAQALTVDPNHIPALVHLGMALRQQGLDDYPAPDQLLGIFDRMQRWQLERASDPNRKGYRLQHKTAPEQRNTAPADRRRRRNFLGG